MSLPKIKKDQLDKEVHTSKGSGTANHKTLIDALYNSKGYTMRTVDAVELLYAGDDREPGRIKASFASAKAHCFSKANFKVNFEGTNNEFIKLAGMRAEGKEGADGGWVKIKPHH